MRDIDSDRLEDGILAAQRVSRRVTQAHCKLYPN
jgi:hypothetical protein